MTKYLNHIYLLGCIVLSIVFVLCKMPYELVGILISPLITLLIYKMSEEQKALWNTKYQAFLFLMSMRHNNVDFDVMRHLNSIDIIFIDDKKVRACWNAYYDILWDAAKYSQDELEAKKIDLLDAMSKSLGLDKDIKFSDIKRFYYPQGLVDINAFYREKDTRELEYYNCMIDAVKSKQNY